MEKLSKEMNDQYRGLIDLKSEISPTGSDTDKIIKVLPQVSQPISQNEKDKDSDYLL